MPPAFPSLDFVEVNQWFDELPLKPMFSSTLLKDLDLRRDPRLASSATSS